jgi:transketolase
MLPKKTLHEIARHVRGEVLEVAVKNGAGHIAPSLSCIEILTALYYKALDYDPKNPLWDQRDRFIFSKSHGCYGLYCILAERGMLPVEKWKQFHTDASELTGCSERRAEFGIEAGCGSLGHGLPIAVGSAFGAKLQGHPYHTFCLMGDGETQEGTTWEALQFAVKHQLDNLTIIIDYNRLQAMDFTFNILEKEENDLFKRLTGFDVLLEHCNGHNPEQLADLLLRLKNRKQGGPVAIIADTIKGYGLKCMENKAKFHFRLPTHEELLEGRTDG